MRRALSSPVQWSLPRAGDTHCSDERVWSQKHHHKVCAPEKSKMGFLSWVWQPRGSWGQAEGPMVPVPATLLLLLSPITSSDCICPPSSLSSSCTVVRH